MSDAGRHRSDGRHLLLLPHLFLEHAQLSYVVETPDVAGCVLVVDHYGSNRKPEIERIASQSKRRDFEAISFQLDLHLGKNFTNRQPQRIVRTVSGDFLRGTVE